MSHDSSPMQTPCVERPPGMPSIFAGRADRVAATRLEVRASDPPAHGSICESLEQPASRAIRPAPEEREREPRESPDAEEDENDEPAAEQDAEHERTGDVKSDERRSPDHDRPSLGARPVSGRTCRPARAEAAWLSS